MVERSRTLIAFVALLITCLGGACYWYTQNPAMGAKVEYHPPFDPKNFVSKINNKYFALEPGTKFTYEKKTNKGIERTEVLVLSETKEILGVTTTVVSDR